MLGGTLEYLSQLTPESLMEITDVEVELSLTLELTELLLSLSTGERRQDLEDYRRKLEDLQPKLK